MYVSLQFKLQLDSSDRKKLLELMRKQSSAIRSAYKLLKTKNSHSQIYQKLRQLFPDLPTKYIDVVFGGKTLFEKLCKNRNKKSKERQLHLRITTGKREFVYAGADSSVPKQGKTKKVSQSAWQVLKVAFLFPVLGEVLPGGLSPLKSLLVEGAWDRVRSRLVPLEVGGTPQ